MYFNTAVSGSLQANSSGTWELGQAAIRFGRLDLATMEFHSMGSQLRAGIERWYAIHTKAREEDRAHCNLDAWGVQTFCPKINHLRTHAFTGRPVHVIKHMFPRYIFAYFDAETMLHKIRFTRGIRSVVTVGSVPARVDDEIIDLLRSRVTPEGFITLQDEFKDGDEVYLKEGPFKGFTGVFNARLKSNDRVTILLTAINFQGRLIIDKEMVASADRSRSAEAGACTTAKGRAHLLASSSRSI